MYQGGGKCIQLLYIYSLKNRQNKKITRKIKKYIKKFVICKNTQFTYFFIHNFSKLNFFNYAGYVFSQLTN